MDHVDRIIAQWNRERPDLDVGPMALLGRLNRVRQHLGREIEQVLVEHGLSVAGFDVLATLRRSGAPFRLSPGDLLATTMVTSGTMTNRIDQLEKEGLVERIKNPDDGRSVLISLTPEGRERVDRAVEAHVANQHRLVDGLDARQRQELDAALRVLLATFE